MTTVAYWIGVVFIAAAGTVTLLSLTSMMTMSLMLFIRGPSGRSDTTSFSLIPPFHVPLLLIGWVLTWNAHPYLCVAVLLLDPMLWLWAAELVGYLTRRLRPA